VAVILGPLSSNLWSGLSTDTKPTASDIRLKLNDVFFERDTTKYYLWCGDAWVYNGTISIPPPML
jgi:hypothetical protein